MSTPAPASGEAARGEVCRAFEAALQQGGAPRIEDHLAGTSGEHRSQLFLDLLRLDALYLGRQGLSPAPADYLSRFPEYEGEIREVLEPPSTCRLTASGDPGEDAPTVIQRPGAGRAGALPFIPGYEILEPLGRGGMGVVYKAVQSRLKRTVAVKMILSGDHAGDEDRCRFEREAEAVARLRHPAIVQIFEVGEYLRRPFFSMEYCDGGSLAQRLRGEPLLPREAAGLVARLADAVQAAHDAGVVHRDLKPSNILLTRRPDAGAGAGARLAPFDVRVSDFGLAKLAGGCGQTLTHGIVGTPEYMAPEQARARPDVGPAADVYGLGAILYECLTGRPPFKAATNHDTLAQVMSDEPASLRRLNRQVPSDLETVALKCLEKDPGRRYASAADLSADLRRWLAGEPIRARPVGAIEAACRWVMRHPTRAVLAACALTLLVGAPYAWWAIAASRGAARDAEQRRIQAEKESDSQRLLAETAEFHGLLRQARELTAARRPGWSREVLGRLRRAAALERVARDNRAALHSDLAACLLGHDVLPHGELAKGFPAACSAWRTGGRHVAIGEVRQAGTSSPCRVRLLDVSSGEVVRELTFPGRLRPHPDGYLKLDGVENLGFSPDGRWLAAGSRNGHVWLWDLDQPGGEAKYLDSLAGEVTVVFDTDGRTLIYGGDQALVSWSVTEGREQARITRRGLIGQAALDPRGGVVAVRFNDAREIAFLCARRLEPVGHPAPHDGHPAFAPDGRTLAVRHGRDVWLAAADHPAAARSGTFRAADSEYAEDATVSEFHFSPDGSLLLTVAEFDRRARLWEVSTGRPLVGLVTEGDILGASFAPDGRRILMHVGERSLLFTVTATRWQRYVAPGPSPAAGLVLTAGGAPVVHSRSPEHPNTGELSVWPPGRAPRPLARVAGGQFHQNEVANLTCDPARGGLAFTRDHNKITFWESLGGHSWRTVVQREQVTGLGYGTDGRLWYRRSPTVGLHGLDGASWTNSPLDSPRRASSLTAGTKHGLSGWQDGTLRVHGPDARLLSDRTAGSSPITSVALNGEETLAAAGTGRGAVLVYRVPGLTAAAEAPEAERHTDAVVGLTFLGPRLVLSGGRDGGLALWQHAPGRLRLVLRLQMPRPVVQLAATADGRRVGVLLERERAVRLLDVRGLLDGLGRLGGEDLIGMLPEAAEFPAPPPVPALSFGGVEGPTGVNGLRVEWFADPWFERRVKVRHDTHFTYDWTARPPDVAAPGPGFAARWTGWLVPPEKGKYRIGVRGNGRAWVAVWTGNGPPHRPDAEHVREVTVKYSGRPVPIRGDYACDGSPDPKFWLGWAKEGEELVPLPASVVFLTEEAARRGR